LSPDLQLNCVISFFFRLHLVLHICVARFDVTGTVALFGFSFWVHMLTKQALHENSSLVHVYPSPRAVLAARRCGLDVVWPVVPKPLLSLEFEPPWGGFEAEGKKIPSFVPSQSIGKRRIGSRIPVCAQVKRRSFHGA
jgi:hypothetical protein